MLVVFSARCHRANRVNRARVHTNAGLDNSGIAFFSLTSRGLPFIEVMAAFEYTVGEMKVMPTVAYLNEIGCGGSALVRVGIAHGFRTNLVVIEGNLNAQRYRDKILARHVIRLFQNNANITLFQQDNATSRIARDTVNFLRASNIAFINDWPAFSESHWTHLG